jgi:acetyl esterase
MSFDRPAPLTPAMQAILQGLARAQAKPGFVPMHQMTGAQARAAYAKGADVLEVPKAELTRVEDVTFTNRAGQSIALRLYAPSYDKLPVLLFFHGGGFVVGSVQTHDILCRELARLSGCAVLSVDYRLAPEHTFPAAFDDAWDALLWLQQQGAALGLDTSRIAVGGDSAGGTIAAALAHQARDAGIALALQLLIYPGTSGGADGGRFASHAQYAQGYVLEQQHIHYFFNSTLGNISPDQWQFSPLNAVSFENLAPCWLALAECDPLYDEGLAYADAMRVAGVTVDLEIYRGVTHEFIKMGRALREARQFHQDASLALKTAFNL